MFYYWWYFPVLSLYKVSSSFISESCIKPSFVDFFSKSQYSFMLSYLKILSHRPQSLRLQSVMLSRCTVWSCSIEIKWGEWLWTPERFASVFTPRQALCYFLAFGVKSGKEPWSSVDSFSGSLRVPFSSLVIISPEEISCLSQWYERVGVGAHFCLQAWLWQRARKTGFQRLQGTFHCVGNESTTNVPWQAALK